jgi:serine/threonine protein kinase
MVTPEVHRSADRMRSDPAVGFEMATTMIPRSVTGGGWGAGSDMRAPANRPAERESERAGRVPGQLIAGRFRVIQALGAGSLGAVYLCVETATAKTVAVKLYRRDLARDEEFSDALRRQAACAVALGERQDGIVRIHECGQSADGNLFVVMEFLKGRSLVDIIRDDGPLEVRRTLRLCGQLVGALEAAHEMGVVHGDLRPHHVMVAGSGDDEIVTLKGFEASGVREIGLAGHLRRAGAIPSFPEYTAPEEIEGDAVTARTDIYALGVMLFEMLSGGAPFRGAIPDGILAKHLQDTAAPLDSLRPGIPAVVTLRVSQALEKEPEKRQRYVGDVINEYLFDLAVDELLEEAARKRPWAIRTMSAAFRACLPRASNDGDEPTVGRMVLKTIAGAAVATAVLAPVVWIASPYWLPMFRKAPSVGSPVLDTRDSEPAGGVGSAALQMRPAVPTVPAESSVEAEDTASAAAHTQDGIRERTGSSSVRARQDGRPSSSSSGTAGPAGRAARPKGAPQRSARRPDQPPSPTAAERNARADRSANEPAPPPLAAVAPRGEASDPGAIIDWLLRGR